MGTELLLVFFCYPFIVHGIYSDVPPFISDISNLHLLSFFFVSLARGFLILSIFSKKQLLVLLIFLYWFSVLWSLCFNHGSITIYLRILEGKSLPFSESQSPHLQNEVGDNNTYPWVSLRAYVKCESTFIISINICWVPTVYQILLYMLGIL